MRFKLEEDKKFKHQKLAKTARRRRNATVERDTAEALSHACRNDLLPTLNIEHMALSSLRPSIHHARKISSEHIRRIVISIADLGFTVPILHRDGEIVDGHVRAEAARKVGLTHVPAINVTHLSALELRKLRLAVNRSAEVGEWDMDALRVEISELIELDVDLTATAFTESEIDIILLDGEEKDPVDGADEPSCDGPPVTVSGDLWQLGDLTPIFHPAATRGRGVLSRISAGEATGGVNPARCFSSSAANAAGVA